MESFVNQGKSADFIDQLKAQGWVEAGPYRFRKGHWEIVFDSSGWMELGTEQTPRIFDVPVPETGPRDLTQWTMNLIAHLFESNDVREGLSAP